MGWGCGFVGCPVMLEVMGLSQVGTAVAERPGTSRDIQGLFGEMPVISSPSRLDQVYFNGRCVYTNRSIPVFHTFVSQVRMVVAPRSSLWRTRPWSGRRRRFRQCRTWRSQNGRCWGSNRRYTAYYGILQKHMLVTVSPQTYIFEQKTVDYTDYTNPFMWTFPDQSLGVECYPLFPSFPTLEKNVSWQKSSLICGFVAFTPCFLHMPTSVVCQKIGYPYILCLDIDARYPNFIPNDFLSTTGPQMSFFFPPRK